MFYVFRKVYAFRLAPNRFSSKLEEREVQPKIAKRGRDEDSVEMMIREPFANKSAHEILELIGVEPTFGNENLLISIAIIVLTINTHKALFLRIILKLVVLCDKLNFSHIMVIKIYNLLEKKSFKSNI